MEKVVQAEIEVRERLFYCVAGAMQVVVPERFVIERNGFIIKAEKGYQISFSPSDVVGVKAPVLNINLGITKNVELNCSMICDLSEDDPLYRGVLEQMGKIN